MAALYQDRKDAGRKLAAELARRYGARDDVLILGLPRGGVPVAYEVASRLGSALDVCIVRKLGLPQNPEYAMGAIASGGITVLDHRVVEMMSVSRQALDAVIGAEQTELRRREKSYRDDLPPPAIKDRDIILVDDGLATGLTMRAAIAGVRKHGPRSIIVAVPLASEQACDVIRAEADEAVCLATPEPFQAVGAWYASFPQTEDAEVHELLARARRQHGDNT